MDNKTILVTGGAGYIGGFMVRSLLAHGYRVVTIDDLSRNEEPQFPEGVEFVKGNIGQRDILKNIFEKDNISGVIHFAAYISMGESMRDPFIYFEDNTYNGLVLLEEMKNHNVKNIIFSSTAGVYGNPSTLPIPEDDIKNPTNPYGESKLMFEKILLWYQRVYGTSFVALRYFNACGASLDGLYGEAHKPETHLIPNVINSILENRELSLFGTDYETPDGTCVRDYIHVLDLVEAHLLALERIINEPGGYVYNVGTGRGYSNREVINMVEEVAGRKVNVIEKERRPGDAKELVANVSKITDELGFKPQYSDLHTIIDSAWKWHNK